MPVSGIQAIRWRAECPGSGSGNRLIVFTGMRIRLNCLQCSDEIREKACGVVIPFIQRQPGDRSLKAGDPFADHCGFTKSGGGGDEGELVTELQTLIEPFDQLGAGDEVLP